MAVLWLLRWISNQPVWQLETSRKGGPLWNITHWGDLLVRWFFSDLHFRPEFARVYFEELYEPWSSRLMKLMLMSELSAEDDTGFHQSETSRDDQIIHIHTNMQSVDKVRFGLYSILSKLKPEVNLFVKLFKLLWKLFNNLRIQLRFFLLSLKCRKTNISVEA